MKNTIEKNFMYFFIFIIAFNLFYDSSLLLFFLINSLNIYIIYTNKIKLENFFRSKGLTLILLFSVLFNIISLIMNKQVYLYILLILPSMYILGTSIYISNKFNIEILIISIALGFLANVLFDYIYTFFLNNGFVSRNLNSIFTTDLYVSATIEAIKLVFPIAIILPLFFSSKKIYKIISLFIIFCVILTNSVLLSRNVLLDMCIAIFIYIIYRASFVKKVIIKYKNWFYILLFFMFSFLIFILLKTDIMSSFFNIERIISDTERVKTLASATSGLIKYPFGGHQMNLGQLNFAHNMWLDVANISGIIPFLVLLLFTFRYIYMILKLGRKVTLPYLFSSNILLVGTGACFFEPILFSNALFYSFMCLIIALLENHYAYVKIYD